MSFNSDKTFGKFITRLIQKECLSREESYTAFSTLLKNETSEIQQGAFLAALTAKGETEDEVAGSWEAIYELDTVKVKSSPEEMLVENSGTGMDTFKTFNISTAASLIAAAGGVKMARHGARAITSICGTVDMAEQLGIDVECSAEKVAESIRSAGIGLFNGMSPQIHPQALGRILSQVHFGSTLNIAASLANPALPKLGVRGVYSLGRVLPVVKVMKAIGYKKALVYYGGIENSHLGMDEASVCGITHCAELKENGEIESYSFHPSDFGLSLAQPEHLSPNIDIQTEARSFVSLLQGNAKRAKSEAAALNAGLIYYIAGKSETIEEGVRNATEKIKQGSAFETLENWVAAQSMNPNEGKKKLAQLY